MLSPFLSTITGTEAHLDSKHETSKSLRILAFVTEVYTYVTCLLCNVYSFYHSFVQCPTKCEKVSTGIANTRNWTRFFKENINIILIILWKFYMGTKMRKKNLDALHFVSTMPLGQFEQPLKHPGSEHQLMKLVLSFDPLDLNFFKWLVKLTALENLQ